MVLDLSPFLSENVSHEMDKLGDSYSAPAKLIGSHLVNWEMKPYMAQGKKANVATTTSYPEPTLKSMTFGFGMIDTVRFITYAVI